MKTYKIYCKSTGIQYGKIYAEDWCDLMTQLSKSGGNIEDIIDVLNVANILKQFGREDMILNIVRIVV